MDPNNGKVFFKHVSTNERLFARPADVADSTAMARVREIAQQRAGNNSSAAHAHADDLPLTRPHSLAPQVQMWTTFLEDLGVGTVAPKHALPPALPGMSENDSETGNALRASGAIVDADRIPTQNPAAGTGRPGGSGGPSTSAAAGMSSAAKLDQIKALLPPKPPMLSKSSSSSAHVLGGGFSGGSALLTDDDEDDDDIAISTQAAGSATAASPAHNLVVSASDLPDAPTAVPITALNSLALDLNQLSRKMAGKPPRGTASPAGKQAFAPLPLSHAPPSSGKPASIGNGNKQASSSAAGSVLSAPPGLPLRAQPPPRPAPGQLQPEAFAPTPISAVVSQSPSAAASSTSREATPRPDAPPPAFTLPAPPPLPPTTPLAVAVPSSDGLVGDAGGDGGSGSAVILPSPQASAIQMSGVSGHEVGDQAARAAAEEEDIAKAIALSLESASESVQQHAQDEYQQLPPEWSAAGGDAQHDAEDDTEPFEKVDFEAYLGPVFGDPLLVDMAQLAAQAGPVPSNSSAPGGGIHTNHDGADGTGKGISGVHVLRVQQPADEDVLLPRYLVVTPFTVSAVAPHPTKLGKGIQKWERSILSLQHLVSQPIFTTVAGPGAAGAGKSGGGASSAVLGSSAVAANSSGSSDFDEEAGDDASVFETLPFDAGAGTAGGARSSPRKPASSLPSKSSKSLSISSSIRNIFGSGNKKSAPSTVPPTAGSASSKSTAGSGAQAQAPAKREDGRRYKMHGIGLLASFMAETPDTLCFLRTYRAGKRPVTLSGWLQKRKRNGWRQNAPIGPLAWKKRWFVLEATRITYYKSNGAGAVAKGVIPLTGWVEVTKAGPDAGPITQAIAPDATNRPHAFVVRTGKSYHVFQAGSAAEAEEWVAAISINAQHVGACQDEPQCVILPSHGDAEALAKIIAQRRSDLLSSISPDSSLPAAVEMTVDLTASAVVDSHVQARARTASTSSMLGSPLLSAVAASMSASSSSHAGSGRSSPFIQAAATPTAYGQLPDHLSLSPSYGAQPSQHDNAYHAGAGDGGITVAEAENLVRAMGEASDELLSQLSPSVAAQIVAKYRPNQPFVHPAAAQRAGSTPPTGGQPSAPTSSAQSVANNLYAAVHGHAPTSTNLLPQELARGYHPHHPQYAPSSSSSSSSMGGASAAQMLHVHQQAPHPWPFQVAEGHWIYLDDSDAPQGPFPDSLMRQWLWARYFGPETLMRSADPLPTRFTSGAHAQDFTIMCCDSRAVPQAFLPLSTLFPDPSMAFTAPGTAVWPQCYIHATAYQTLLVTGIGLGLERQHVQEAVVLMQQHGVPPDVSALLDVIAAIQSEHASAAGASTSRAGGSASGARASAASSSGTTSEGSHISLDPGAYSGPSAAFIAGATPFGSSAIPSQQQPRSRATSGATGTLSAAAGAPASTSGQQQQQQAREQSASSGGGELLVLGGAAVFLGSLLG